MDYLEPVGSSVLVVGLIFFIFNRAIQTSNYKRRAIFNLIFGLTFTVILFAGFIYDLNSNPSIITITYFSLPLSLIVISSILVILNLVKARKFHHKFNTFVNHIHKEENYLYILYKYEDCYLLNKEEDNNYTGITIKFDKKILFHDEMIENVINSYNLNILSKEMIGKFNIIEKKKIIYYCYVIELNNLDGLDNLYQVSKFNIANMNMLPFHKNLILRMLVKEKFDIRK